MNVNFTGGMVKISYDLCVDADDIKMVNMQYGEDQRTRINYMDKVENKMKADCRYSDKDFDKIIEKIAKAKSSESDGKVIDLTA